MSEFEPTMHLPLEDGGVLDATRSNTRLYTFEGEGELEGVPIDNDNFDHVFIQTGEDDGSVTGSYVFRVNPVTGESQDNFMEMLGYMAHHHYPMKLYERTVPECDKRAYLVFRDRVIASAVENMDDFIPDWMQDGTQES